MVPGGRDKKLCDCLAYTLRKESEGRRERGRRCEVTSECYTSKPDPSASGRFYDLSRQHHHLETKSSNTRPLGDTSHSTATALERQLIGEVEKKGPTLEPALRAFAFE